MRLIKCTHLPLTYSPLGLNFLLFRRWNHELNKHYRISLHTNLFNYDVSRVYLLSNIILALIARFQLHLGNFCVIHDNYWFGSIYATICWVDIIVSKALSIFANNLLKTQNNAHDMHWLISWQSKRINLAARRNSQFNLISCFDSIKYSTQPSKFNSFHNQLSAGAEILPELQTNYVYLSICANFF